MSRTLRALIATLALLIGLCPTHFATAATDLSEPSSAPPAEEAEVEIPTGPSVTNYELLKQHLSIKSVNPGFKIAELAETGEAIELYNDSEFSLPLEHIFLRYYNSSGTPYEIYAFPEKSAAVGKTIVLRYDKSPEVKSALEVSGDFAEIADVVYAKTLALTGSLEIVYRDDSEDKIIDSLCWTGKTGCFAKFNSANPGTLVRDINTRELSLTNDYTPDFTKGLYLPPDPVSSDDGAETASPQCLDLEFSEILSYYDESKDEQFLEIYNPTDEKISLSGCRLKYKNKFYNLETTNASSENPSNAEVPAASFYVYRPRAVTFTKNPNSENIIDLVDVTDEIVATLKYPHGQKKGTAYATISRVWQTTYYPTPGSPNIAQEFRTCPLGKVINEQTGNCVRAETLASVKPCPAGKYRSPETGRCRKIGSDTSSPKPCKTGYERNPETGRCRKIKVNNGADYALVPVTGGSEKSSFVALGALLALAVLGLIFLIYQFRKEIIYFFRRLWTKLRK